MTATLKTHAPSLVYVIMLILYQIGLHVDGYAILLAKFNITDMHLGKETSYNYFFVWQRGESFGFKHFVVDEVTDILRLHFRDRMLHRIINPLASCSSTLTHYDENSYLRDKRLRDYLIPLLQTLSEEKVKIVLEASITRGID